MHQSKEGNRHITCLVTVICFKLFYIQQHPLSIQFPAIYIRYYELNVHFQPFEAHINFSRVLQKLPPLLSLIGQTVFQSFFITKLLPSLPPTHLPWKSDVGSSGPVEK